MLSWNEKTPKSSYVYKEGPSSSPLDDTATMPNGTFPVGSLSIVADDQAVYLVLNVPSPGGFRSRQIGILLAERQGARKSKDAAAACSHALVTKFGQDTAVAVVKSLVKEYGPKWALKYLPLDDHIFELYDDARHIGLTIVIPSDQGGDTW